MLAADAGERSDALVWLATADEWARSVEDWCVTTTGADGHEPPYYMRINDDTDPDDGADLALANGGPTLDERAVVDAGFLELVRLGIRPADDPIIRNSVSVVDETIRRDTPNGPAWYRYTGDGYGEQADGSPWRSSGQGRLWPLLTGERGEYELRRGTDSGELTPGPSCRRWPPSPTRDGCSPSRSGTARNPPSTTGCSARAPVRRRRCRGRWPSTSAWPTPSTLANRSRRPPSSPSGSGPNGTGPR
ncbi:glycoside hydrolase family 15 protein [Halomicroarcula sp. GCM10025709]|uniref:glycoside hydrolase family 15 protein n=1 Tax=Halomicroarcula sp. GCM10025709 TaxID=3252669 RepID=UPI003611F7E8